MRTPTGSKRVGYNITAHMGDMTQEELAKASGVKLSVISNYVRGLCEPSAFKLKRIANVLDCTVDDLLEGVES